MKLYFVAAIRIIVIVLLPSHILSAPIAFSKKDVVDPAEKVSLLPIAESELYCDLTTLKFDMEFADTPQYVINSLNPFLYTAIGNSGEHKSDSLKKPGTISISSSKAYAMVDLSEECLINLSITENGNTDAYSHGNLYYEIDVVNLKNITVSVDCSGFLSLKSNEGEIAYGAFKGMLTLQKDMEHQDVDYLKYYHKIIGDEIFYYEASKKLSVSFDFSEEPYNGYLYLYFLNHSYTYTKLPVPENGILSFAALGILAVVFSRKVKRMKT